MTECVENAEDRPVKESYMIEIIIPGRETLCIKYLVLDLNGTLAFDGVLIAGVAERLERLQRQLSVYLLTADMHGTAAKLADDLKVELKRIEHTAEAERKRRFVTELGENFVAAIGAGANDAEMLRAAALGIAVLGPEGLAAAALSAADVVTPGINEALDLLLVPNRLITTLRR